METSSSEYSAFRLFLRNKSLVVGVAMISVVIFMALFATWIVPYDPMQIDLSRRLEPPSLSSPFGRDSLGRDILSRIILGARTSMLVALISVGLSLAISIIPGTIAAYYVDSRLDHIIMRIADVILSLPSLLIAIGIVSALGAGLTNVIISISIANIAPLLRIVRGSVLTIKNNLYVESAKAIGESTLMIILKTILPNAIGFVLTYVMLRMGVAILIGSSLSFLGIGIQPPEAEWGLMVSESRGFLASAPHAVIIPGLFISFAVLGFNILNDGLSDVLNPRKRRTLK